jgi:hypothetical protein
MVSGREGGRERAGEMKGSRERGWAVEVHWRRERDVGKKSYKGAAGTAGRPTVLSAALEVFMSCCRSTAMTSCPTTH